MEIGQITEGKRLARIGALSNLSGLIGRKTIGLGITILLTRALTVEDFGVFSLFLSTFALLGGVSMGFDKIIQRYFPLLLKVDQRKAISLYSIFMVKRYLLLFSLALVGYTANYFGIINLERFDFEFFGLAVIAGAMLAGRSSSTVALNSAYLEHRYLNTVLIVGDLFKLVALIVFWNGKIEGVLLIWIAAETWTFVMVLGRLTSKVRPNLKAFAARTIRELDYKRYYNYGKFLAFASVGTYVLSAEVDYMFLSYFSSNESVGLYAFSAKLVFILLTLVPSNLMFNVTLPLLIRKLDSGGSIKEVQFSIEVFLKLNIFAWTTMASMVAFNIESIIVYFFDIKYLPSKTYIFIWLLLLYALVIKNVFEPVARALEYSRVYLVTIIAGLVNIAGNYSLIPHYGANGALISTGFSLTLQGYMLSIATARQMNMPIKGLRAVTILLRIAVLACIVWFFNIPYGSPVSVHILGNMAVVGAVGIAFWPKWFFSVDERKYMNSFMPFIT